MAKQFTVLPTHRLSSGLGDHVLTLHVAVEAAGRDVIDGLDRTMPVWLGDEPTKRSREHLEHVKQTCNRHSTRLDAVCGRIISETGGRSNEVNKIRCESQA